MIDLRDRNWPHERHDRAGRVPGSAQGARVGSRQARSCLSLRSGRRSTDATGVVAKNAQLAAAADAFARGQLNGEGRCADDGLEAVADKHAEAYAYVARAKAAEDMGTCRKH
jgi:hypothetical protein